MTHAPAAHPAPLATLPPGTVAVSAYDLRRALVHLDQSGISVAKRGGALPTVVDVMMTGDAVAVRRNDGYSDVTVTLADHGSTRSARVHEPFRMEFADLAAYLRQADSHLRAAFRSARATITPVAPGMFRVQVEGDGTDGPTLPAYSVPPHDVTSSGVRHPRMATFDRVQFCRDVAWARRGIDVPDKPGDVALFDQIRAELTPDRVRLLGTDRNRLTITGWHEAVTDDALVGAFSLVVLPGVVTGRLAARFAKLDADTVTLETSANGRVTALECGPVRAVLRLPQDTAGPRDLTWPTRQPFDAAVTVNRAGLSALVSAVRAAHEADPYEVSAFVALFLAADGTVSVGQVDGPVAGTLAATYAGFTPDPAAPLRVAFQLRYLLDVLDAFTGDTLTLTGVTTPGPQWPDGSRPESRMGRAPWMFTDQPGQACDVVADRYLVMPLDNRR